MKKNYIAPILVVGLLGLYYVGMIALFCIIPGIAWWAKLLLSVIPAAICSVLVYVLVQRIRELQSNETDDLDKY
ncbi:MAG: hypothetical protein E7632_00625 [Ruminococcaceae bacterium]|nr:hypothetical protein [Oscillospiraceae bacterium]